MREEKVYLNVCDVMEITGKRQSKSYSIIRQLNRELENQGYYIIQGKVPKKYFFERIGG